MRAYIDTDILIWHLRGDERANYFLDQISNNQIYELWIGAMQRAEIVFFMQSKEVKMTELLLAQFKTAPVDQKIVDLAGILYRKWHPKQGIDVNDAILAATVMQTGGEIFSLNAKHYPMPDVLVQTPW